MNNYSLSDDSILDLRSIEVSKRKYKEEIKSTIDNVIKEFEKARDKQPYEELFRQMKLYCKNSQLLELANEEILFRMKSFNEVIESF